MQKQTYTLLIGLIILSLSLSSCNNPLGTVEKVEAITSVNTDYRSQLNAAPIQEQEDIIRMADETIPLEFDGPTWAELRVMYGLSVPDFNFNVKTETPLAEVEQLDPTEHLITLAIEEPLEADDGKYYILLKGDWYEFDKTTGISAYVNNKCEALHFRQGPSTVNTILDILKSDTFVNIYKAAHMSDGSTWYYVKKTDGTLGWQHSYYLNLGNSAVRKPSNVEILSLIKDTTETVETINTTFNCDKTGKLTTLGYKVVADPYKETGYTSTITTKTYLWEGAGYTNKRLPDVNIAKGSEIKILAKAFMSNKDTWYKIKITLNDTEYIGYIEYDLEKNIPEDILKTLWVNPTAEELVKEQSRINTQHLVEPVKTVETTNTAPNTADTIPDTTANTADTIPDTAPNTINNN